MEVMIRALDWNYEKCCCITNSFPEHILYKRCAADSQMSKNICLPALLSLLLWQKEAVWSQQLQLYASNCDFLLCEATSIALTTQKNLFWLFASGYIAILQFYKVYLFYAVQMKPQHLFKFCLLSFFHCMKYSLWYKL